MDIVVYISSCNFIPVVSAILMNLHIEFSDSRIWIWFPWKTFTDPSMCSLDPYPKFYYFSIYIIILWAFSRLYLLRFSSNNWNEVYLCCQKIFYGKTRNGNITKQPIALRGSNIAFDKYIKYNCQTKKLRSVRSVVQEILDLLSIFRTVKPQEKQNKKPKGKMRQHERGSHVPCPGRNFISANVFVYQQQLGKETRPMPGTK